MESSSTSGQYFQRSILLSLIGMILAGCTSSSPTTSLAPDLSNLDLSASSVDISLYYEGNLQSVEPKDAAISFALIQEPPITDPTEIVDFVGTEDPTGLQIPIQLNDIDPELLDIEDSDLNGNGEIDLADTAILFWLSQGLRDPDEIIEACLVVPGIDCSFDPDAGPIDQILTLPQITSPLTAEATIGIPFAYQIVASANPTSFAVTEGLPAGLSINAETGLITGVPTGPAGEVSLTISATNSNGTTTATLSLNLLADAPDQPEITSPVFASARVGDPFSYAITATNTPTTFAATGLPEGLSLDPATGLITGTLTAESLAGSPYNVTISATNASGTASTTIILLVNPESAPQITSSLDETASVGDLFTYPIEATGATQFDALGLPEGLSVDRQTGEISGTPTTAVGSPFQVLISATNDGGTAFEILTLTINDPTALPVITSPTAATATLEVAFQFQITATNNPTSFGASGLPDGLNVDPITGQITGIPSGSPTISDVTISATNANGTTTATLTLTILSLNQDQPQITSPLAATASVGQAFEYQIEATNNPTSFDATGLPDGLSIDQGTGLISGTPSPGSLAESPYNVTISATNASGTGIAALSLEIEQPGPPEIVSPLNVEATRGIPFTYQIAATNEPTNYAGGPFPPELELDPETGRISGIPDIAAGMYEIPIRAFNDLGEDIVDLSLTVRELDLALAPEITSPTLVTARVGTEFIYTITATNTPTAFNLSGDLPTGLSFDPGTGQITGTPVNTTGSPFNLALSASNENGEAITNITLLVVPAEAPLITSPLEQTFTACEPFDYLIEADNTPILQFAADPLPETLTVDPFTGEISGTIQNPEQSPFQITISATNAGGTASQTLRMELEPGEEALVFADPLLETAILDQIGKDDDQKVFPCDVVNLTQLSTTQNRNIESLEGIQALTSLQDLFIRGNLISDLTPLSELTGLTRLFAEDNQISDLTPLSSLINLEQLFLNFNDITDLTPLSPLTNLIILQLNNNDITDLTGLETLETLIFLQINSNDIVDLAPLSSLTTLLELELATNSIEEVTPLSNLTQLTLLSLNLNNIQNIAPLGNLVRLTDLRLADNTIVNIGPLQTLTNIENLEIEDNDIVDLNPLSDLPNLIFVNLQNNQIMDIQPLVDNVNGLASGDQVFLDDNPLDDNSINVLIPALEVRGVQVRF